MARKHSKQAHHAMGYASARTRGRKTGARVKKRYLERRPACNTSQSVISGWEGGRPGASAWQGRSPDGWDWEGIRMGGAAHRPTGGAGLGAGCCCC